MTASHAVLVADRDKDFLRAIETDPAARTVIPRLAISGREVLALLTRQDPPYCGFFINPRVSIPYGTAVFRACRAQCPKVPAYALLDPGENPPDEAEIKSLGLAGVITKPVNYRGMISQVRPDLLEYTPVAPQADPAPVEKASEKADEKADEKAIEEAVEAQGADFIPILARDFLSGSVVQFDVFVQMGLTRFLKILRAGDAFDRSRVETYLKKGVTHFFVRREDQERLMQFMGTVSSALVKEGAGASGHGMAVNQSMAHGEQVMRYLFASDPAGAQMEYARRFTRNLQALVPRLKRTAQSQEFSSILDSAIEHEHAVAVAMVASLLAKEMGFDSEQALHQVGVACLMHDVALVKFHPELEHEDVGRMSEAERVRFHGHPKRGAEYLASLKVVPEGVIQAVSQHHERRDGSGFPGRLSGQSIHRVAEIIGVAEELIRAYEKSGGQPDAVSRLTWTIQHGFSAQVSNAFVDVFQSSKKKPGSPGSAGTPRGGSPSRPKKPRGRS